MKYWLMSLSFLLAAPFTVSAEEQESNTSTGETKVELNNIKPKDDKSNTQITNARLAADAGSMSKFSLRSVLGYNGGTLNNPFGRVRPNYRKLPGGPIRDTSIGGSFGLAYRIDKESQLRLDTGVSMRFPFDNKVSELADNVSDRNGRRIRIFNVSGLSGSYNKTYRKGNLMISPTFGASVTTDDYLSNVVGSLGSVSASLTTILDLEGSSWQPGVSVSVYQAFYRDGGALDAADQRRENIGGGIYPFAEYQFNDVYAFRTVFGFFNYTNYRDQGLSSITQDGNYISSGLGISPKKGIWFYPNIQFNPNDTRLEMTNVGISTILNVF